MGSFPGFCPPALIQSHAPPTELLLLVLPSSPQLVASGRRFPSPFGQTGAALLLDGGKNGEKWGVGRTAARAINHNKEENVGGRRDGGKEKAGTDG